MSSFSIDTIRDLLMTQFLSGLDEINNYINVTKGCLERIKECNKYGTEKELVLKYFETKINLAKIEKMILVGFKNNSPEKFMLKLKDKYLAINSELLEYCSNLVDIDYMNEKDYLFDCNRLKSHWGSVSKMYDILL